MSFITNLAVGLLSQQKQDVGNGEKKKKERRKYKIEIQEVLLFFVKNLRYLPKII